MIPKYDIVSRLEGVTNKLGQIMIQLSSNQCAHCSTFSRDMAEQVRELALSIENLKAEIKL